VLLSIETTVPGRELIAHFGYITSVILFMIGIMRMGRIRTARSGNLLAAGAMLLAVVAMFIEMGAINPVWIIIGLLIGAAIGGYAAWKVQLTQMPEMVALFNGSGGLASALVALAAYSAAFGVQPLAGLPLGGGTPGFVNGVAVALSVLIGGVTFTGSLVAFGKLSRKLPSKGILLPGRHVVNVALIVLMLGFSVAAVFFVGGWGAAALIVLVTVIALVLGVLLVLPIGGGDMPVVISLLNSYSGIAAAMAGFAINSPVLIVAGSLVGAAGLILTRIMCKAMNRSLLGVLIGGFGVEDEEDAGEYQNVKSADPEEVAMMLEDAASVIIAPGYGLAVAQAQHAVQELAQLLEQRGINVRFAIHPVAGRMPGHMNVLLAEAKVPYDKLFEMERINSEFKNTDVVFVVGANDVANPVAKDQPGSRLYGMPVLDVTDARTVYTIKRSLAPGFAGVKNTLFEAENNYMVFGDARAIIEQIISAVKEG
jgi:H+-translocating NAD(P) transhydrogenase subunit beta